MSLALAAALALCGVGTGVALAQSADTIWAQATGERPPEPDAYRDDDYRAPVPATLAGATVVDAAGAMTLHQAGTALFIDVLPHQGRPPSLPATVMFREKKRDNIAGSTWLPNVGYGRLNAEMETYFRTNLAALSGGDKTRALVFYCLADCWMSWNAARRALEWGYTDVTWFPDGTDGWTAAGGAVVPARPVAGYQ